MRWVIWVSAVIALAYAAAPLVEAAAAAPRILALANAGAPRLTLEAAMETVLSVVVATPFMVAQVVLAFWAIRNLRKF